MKTLKKNNISQGSSINSPVPVNKDCELPPFFNEDYFGHVVVQTIAELNDIPCKLRQDGMVATVVQDSYAEWQLQSSRIGFSKCDNRSWVKINSGDTFYDGSNLFIFPTQAEADVYKSTPAVKEGQVIYIIETNTYFKYDGQDEYVDPFPNKLTVPTEDGVEGPDYKVPAYLADGAPYWRSTKDFGKVKSVNNKIGDVILKASDLENDSDYTTNATLTAHTSNKSNPHNVTKSQVELGNVDNTSDLNKPISTATQIELNKKINKPTTNNTPDYVLLADGSTAAKSDFGKVDKVMGVSPDANKNVDISGVAMNWKNASQRFSGLLDKSADATYNQLLGVDSNGNIAKVGLNAVTNAMSKSSDAQKDAFRLASRKSTEGYSIGVPRVDYILPNLIANNKDEITYVSVVGLNLLLNLQDCEVKLINVATNQEYLVSVIQTIAQSSSMFSFGFNFFNKPVGDYRIFVRNGILTNIDTTVFTLVESISTEPLAVNFNRYFKEGLSEAYKNTFTIGVNSFSKMRDKVALGNVPIFAGVSETPVILDQTKDFILKLSMSVTLQYSSYLGKFSVGLSQNPVNNINNSAEIGVSINTNNVNSSLTNKVLAILNSGFTPKNMEITFIKKGSIYSIVIKSDNIYTSDVASLNIVNPLSLIITSNSCPQPEATSDSPVNVNLISLQYLN